MLTDLGPPSSTYKAAAFQRRDKSGSLKISTPGTLDCQLRKAGVGLKSSEKSPPGTIWTTATQGRERREIHPKNKHARAGWEHRAEHTPAEVSQGSPESKRVASEGRG